MEIISVCVMCLKYRMGDVIIISTPNISSSEGINSRCRRFDLLLFAVLAQSLSDMTAVAAVQVVAVATCRWRPTTNYLYDRSCRRSGFRRFDMSLTINY